MRWIGSRTESRAIRLAVACLAVSIVSARAGTVIIGPDANNPATQVDSVTGFVATGASMAGMQVTVNFVGGGSSTTSWVSLGGTSGHATGSIGNGTWTLGETGDTGAANSSNPNQTATNPWTLTNTATNVAIASVSIDALPGGVVFDRDNFTNGQIGTPNSNFGIDYTFASESGANSPFTANVTYSHIVQITGAGAGAPGQGSFYAGTTTTTGCGDLFSGLSFTLSGSGPLPFEATAAGNAVWNFFQDTDPVVQVPEPSSLTLLTAALALTVLHYRRRLLRKS